MFESDRTGNRTDPSGFDVFTTGAPLATPRSTPCVSGGAVLGPDHEVERADVLTDCEVAIARAHE